MSTYYSDPKVTHLEREEWEADVRGKIEQIRFDLPRAGYRQLLPHLKRSGISIGERKLRKVIQRFVATTDSHHKFYRSRKCNPYDNAWLESFIKTLKDHEVYIWNYETYIDVIERVPYFIEKMYSKKRLHSSLNYFFTGKI